MRIVFIGPPGAGKGTQCARLADHLQVPHLSTGKMLRAVQAEQSALGRQIARQLNAGQLAPDYLVLRIVKKRLRDPDVAEGCLFDGFPRTVNQAKGLDEFLHSREDKIDLVLHLAADRERLMARLLKRAAEEDREDDNEATISARMKVYEEETAPVLDYYRGQEIVETIDATRPPEAVFQAVCRTVEAVRS